MWTWTFEVVAVDETNRSHIVLKRPIPVLRRVKTMMLMMMMAITFALKILNENSLRNSRSET